MKKKILKRTGYLLLLLLLKPLCINDITWPQNNSVLIFWILHTLNFHLGIIYWDSSFLKYWKLANLAYTKKGNALFIGIMNYGWWWKNSLILIVLQAKGSLNEAFLKNYFLKTRYRSLINVMQYPWPEIKTYTSFIYYLLNNRKRQNA